MKKYLTLLLLGLNGCSFDNDLPEYDGLYLSTEGEYVEVVTANATHWDNPTIISPKNYCSDEWEQKLTEIDFSTFENIIVKHPDVKNFTFHNSYEVSLMRGSKMCASIKRKIDIRKKQLAESVYLYEVNRADLKTGRVYVGWINKDLWFFKLQ